ncbi:metallophosphoesterase [Alphaproteobacteria bacterium]|nr:metallophosphoesterase [Alphaproteobacteria bacterium]
MFTGKFKFLGLILAIAFLTIGVSVTNIGNFNGRVESYLLTSLKAVDKIIFKNRGLEQDREEITLFVLGHTYGNYNRKEKLGYQTHPKVLEALKDLVRENRNAKILLLGDLVERPSWDNVLRAHNEILQIVDDPIILLGNHDVHFTSYLKLLERRYSSYFTAEFGNVLFVFLNTTNKMGDVDEVQLDLVSEELNKKNYQTVFFFSHHVIWNRDPKMDKFLNNDSTTRKRSSSHLFSDFLQELSSSDVSLKKIFVAGDMGNNTSYLDIKEKDSRFISLGFGNNVLQTRPEKSYGFLSKITVNKYGDYRVNKVLID